MPYLTLKALGNMSRSNSLVLRSEMLLWLLLGLSHRCSILKWICVSSTLKQIACRICNRCGFVVTMLYVVFLFVLQAQKQLYVSTCLVSKIQFEGLRTEWIFQRWLHYKKSIFLSLNGGTTSVAKSGTKNTRSKDGNTLTAVTQVCTCIIWYTHNPWIIGPSEATEADWWFLTVSGKSHTINV